MRTTRPTHLARDIAVAVGVVTLLGAELGTELTRQRAPGELETYLIQLYATFIGAALAAAGGIWLFFFSSAKTDEDKQEKLITALAGEIRSILDTLRRPPTPVPGPDGDEIGRAVLVNLPFVVATEAVRSGLFDADDTLFLSNLIGWLRVHNNEVFFILSTRVGGPVQRESLHYMVAELKQRQKDICADSRDFLAYLESQGVRSPSTQAVRDNGPSSTPR